MAPRQQEVPELSYLPTYTPETRPPPPSGPPPAYQNVIRKVYPYSLRPVVVVTSFISFLYLALISISNFKDIGSSGNNSAMNLFDILIGVLLMVVAVLELFGMIAAIKTNLKLATLYSRLAIPGLALVIAAEILGVVGHYIFKTRLINNCVNVNTGASAPSGFFGNPYSGSDTTMSAADAQSYCNSRWSYDASWEIVWLVITVVVGIPFILFSFAFVRQLQDPSSVRIMEGGGWWRRRNQAPSAQYGQQGPYDPQSQHQAYPLGSYPPAPYGASYGNPYAPPPGPPPQTFDNRDLPDYERGDMQGDFDDRKNDATSPTTGYGYSEGVGRSSSSQRRDTRQLDAAKDSQVTVRLDDDDMKDSKTKTSTRAHDDDDDDAPRI